MQPSTSFFRFVLEHLMRHTKPRREDFPIESGFLPHAPSRFFNRSFGAPAHVLGCNSSVAISAQR
jgi:hypothetical protein